MSFDFRRQVEVETETYQPFINEMWMIIVSDIFSKINPPKWIVLSGWLFWVVTWYVLSKYKDKNELKLLDGCTYVSHTNQYQSVTAVLGQLCKPMQSHIAKLEVMEWVWISEPYTYWTFRYNPSEIQNTLFCYIAVMALDLVKIRLK